MSQLAQLDDALRSRAPTPAEGSRRASDAHAAAEATRALQAAEAAVAALPPQRQPQRRAKRAELPAPPPPPPVEEEEEELHEPPPPPPPPPQPKVQRPYMEPVPGTRIGPVPAHAAPQATLRGGMALGHTLSVGEAEALRAAKPPPQPAAPPARAPRADDGAVRCFNPELAAMLLG